MSENVNTPEITSADLEARPELNLALDETVMYGERFSFAQSLHNSFEEMYADGGLPPEYYYPEENEQLPVPETDQVVFREVMKKVMTGLQESGYIKKARLELKKNGPEALDEYDRRHIIETFEKVRDRAIKSVQMTPDQRNRLTFETKTELNRDLRTSILSGAAPEAWMILNPKLKKIDNLDSHTIVRSLKRLLTTKNEDNIKAEIRIIQAEAKNKLTQAQDALQNIMYDDELKKHIPKELTK